MVAVSVHPHTRGDNHVMRHHVASRDGSPPHTWGQLLDRVDAPVKKRFTPTHVGTMSSSFSLLSAVPVHPHTRGDNRNACTCVSKRVGSPPHTWGQFHEFHEIYHLLRFTPTHVGTIFLFLLFQRFFSVHPHTRGDNI